MWLPMVLMAAPSLIVVAPCGLPLALACRRLWWLGFRRAAWSVGAALGTVTVAASLLLARWRSLSPRWCSACRYVSRRCGWPGGVERGRRRAGSADLSQRVSAERRASAISASVNSSIVCISRAASHAWVTEPCRSNPLPYSVALSTPPRAHAPKQAVAAAKRVIQEAERRADREGAQPQRDLGQLHRHGVLVDAVDAALEDHAPDDVAVDEPVPVNGPSALLGVRHNPVADGLDAAHERRDIALYHASASAMAAITPSAR